MIRLVLFLIVLGAIALGAAWIAERPGEVVMTWQGWRISTSLAVAFVGLIALVFAALIVWSVLRFVLRSPKRVAEYVQDRRRVRGWQAVSRGLIAVGTGNLYTARRSAGEARKLLGPEPLTLLLAAQAAQLAGDGAKAEAEFRQMLTREDTKLLGLRGLFVEARRRNDAVAAYAHAEAAATADPSLAWAGEALLEFRSRAGDWSGAMETLDRQTAAKAVDKALGRRRRAVLLTAQALAIEETRPGRARELAGEAARLAPDLVPAVALAGRLEGAAGNLRRAARMIERAWAAHPHPELAEVYADLRPGDTARDRLKRTRTLTQRTPGHPESMIAIARAALEAHDFDQARVALAPLLAEPTQRVCMLMAEIEAVEHGDHGKAREWAARAVHAKRDPAWVADSYVSERWLPASPVTGKLDAFVWIVPPGALAGPLLEQAADRALAARPVAAAAESTAAAPTIEIAPTVVEPETKAERRKRAQPAAADPVVAEPPLPDDPGPEPAPEPAQPRVRFRLFEWFTGPRP